MAKDNRLKKGAAVAFDENLLIGKLSGLSRSASPAPAAAPPVERVQPENNTAPQQPAQAPAGVPVAAAVPVAAGDREGEKGNTDLVPVPASSVPVNSPAEGGMASQHAKKPKSGKGWDYGRFLVATDSKKKAHVYITDENHQKIKQVLSLFGNKLAIADYLDNLLAQHWEQYDPEIQERMQQMFSKK
jgi:hypothetical protein